LFQIVPQASTIALQTFSSSIQFLDYLI